MQESVSIREFARRIGVSDSAVRKAIKNGRIHGAALVGSKLDFVLASAQFKKNCDISKKRKVKKKEPTLKQNIVPITSIKDIERKFPALQNDDSEDYEKSTTIKAPKDKKQSEEDKIESELNRQRARKEKANADKAELQVLIMRGELIEVEKVTKAIFETSRATRNHWLKFADRASGPLAAKLGIGKKTLKTLLLEEVKEHCLQMEDLSIEAEINTKS